MSFSTTTKSKWYTTISDEFIIFAGVTFRTERVLRVSDALTPVLWAIEGSDCITIGNFAVRHSGRQNRCRKCHIVKEFIASLYTKVASSLVDAAPE